MKPAEFVKALHQFTTGPIALQTLPDGRERVTRDAGDIERFVRRADTKELDAYYCPVALQPDANVAPGEIIRRSKRNAMAAGSLWCDIDFKDVTISPDEIETILQSLRFPPSLIVRSGNGLHAYWRLSDAFDVSAETERFEAVLRRLADRFGGDPAPCHVAALMRLPGTYNRKGAVPKLVTVEGSNREYHFEDLEEWLDEQAVVVHRKVRALTPEPESNAFMTAARIHGWKPTLDVKGELERMEKGNIHYTCVRCSASLLKRGNSIDEVVGRLLPAIQGALAAAGEAFQERREERRLRAMCRAWMAKHPIEARKERKEDRVMDEPGELHEYGEAVAKKKAKEGGTEGKPAMPSMVADGVIETLRREGMDLMLTEGQMWLYRNGVWSIAEANHEQHLRALIQEGCDVFEKSHDSKVANAAWKRLNEHPALYRPSAPWLTAPRIACTNGVLDILTRLFEPFRPDHYAQQMVGVAFDPNASCPLFEGIMQSFFEDRSGDDQAHAVALIQEWFGAMFAVSMLYREERKALLLVGPSRTGKTELSEFARMLIGGRVAGPSVSEISKQFGLATLYGASAWIRDDAINEGDILDPQRFKTIVTGEAIDIDRKNISAVRGVKLGLPVLLTTNVLPQTRDASDAIFNRSIVLEMTRVVSEEMAREIRELSGVPRGKGIAQWIFDQEGPGILNWALDGLQRLLDRGHYDPPEFARLANQRFKDDNNPVSEFARTALRASETSRVARHDILCALHGWQLEMEGEAARAYGARKFFPRLRGVVPGLGEHQAHTGTRYLTGLALTEEGLSYWKRHHDGPQLKGGSSGNATDKDQVNKPWNTDQPAQHLPF